MHSTNHHLVLLNMKSGQILIFSHHNVNANYVFIAYIILYIVVAIKLLVYFAKLKVAKGM